MKRLTADQVDELARKGPFNLMGQWYDDQDQAGSDYVITWPGHDRNGDLVVNLLGQSDTAPVAPSSTNMLAAVTLGSAVTTTRTSFLLQPDYPRNLRFTSVLAGGNLVGNVTVTGTDRNGNTITEDVAVAGAAGNYDSLKAFATVTSVVLPARTTSADTLSMGYGPALGLPHLFYADSGTVFCVDGAQSTYTLVKSTSDLNKNLITPASALNASRKYLFVYKRLRFGN